MYIAVRVCYIAFGEPVNINYLRMFRRSRRLPVPQPGIERGRLLPQEVDFD